MILLEATLYLLANELSRKAWLPPMQFISPKFAKFFHQNNNALFAPDLLRTTIVMKWFRTVVEIIPQALESIFVDGRHADKVIEYYFKQNKKWGGRDRRFFAECVYETVRWKRLYDDILGSKNDYWGYIACWAHHNKYDVPGWSEFTKIITRDEFFNKLKKIADPGVKQSMPDWIVEDIQEAYPEKWKSIIKNLNQTAPAFLRANTLKTSAKELIKKLQAEEIETEIVENSENTLKLAKRTNVFITDAFKKGLFEMQDVGSQQIAAYLQVEPGMRVIDACAGAGGKTLHIASLMKNKGRLLACDIHEWKLTELKKRTRRAGVDNVETKLISSKLVKRQKESADRLLLDVPCSGLGVLRRNPDTKWKLTRERIKELENIQAEIINEYSKLVKPGEKLVYATCSILPSENQNQVKLFLSKNNGWKLEDEKTLLPGDMGGDGFYMARLKKQQNL